LSSPRRFLVPLGPQSQPIASVTPLVVAAVTSVVVP
jgi:hypothetical protein